MITDCTFTATQFPHTFTCTHTKTVTHSQSHNYTHTYPCFLVALKFCVWMIQIYIFTLCQNEKRKEKSETKQTRKHLKSCTCGV